MSARVVVVGGGIVGTCAARALVREGAAVTVLDPRPPGDPVTASGGDSRLVRIAHGADPIETERAFLARQAWADEDPTGELFVRSGIAFVERGDGFAEASRQAIARVGLTHETERLSRAEAIARFPGMGGRFAGVLFEPTSGFVRAALATAELARRAEREGVVRRAAVAAAIRPREVELATGEIVRADRVLVCAGVFSRALLAPFGDLPIVATRQAIVLWDRAIAAPAYCDLDNDGLYGMPDQGQGFKSALHEPGPAVDPGTIANWRGIQPNSTEIDATRTAAARLFPGLARASAAPSSYLCHYDHTPDGRFLIREVSPDIFVAAGFSGTGFKWAPWLGPRLARWVLGLAPFD